MTNPLQIDRIDPEWMTADELDEAFMALLAKLTPQQQARLLDILTQVMASNDPAPFEGLEQALRDGLPNYVV
jgi:hypothetical protein